MNSKATRKKTLSPAAKVVADLSEIKKSLDTRYVSRRLAEKNRDLLPHRLFEVIERLAVIVQAQKNELDTLKSNMRTM